MLFKEETKNQTRKDLKVEKNNEVEIQRKNKERNVFFFFYSLYTFRLGANFL